MRKEGNYVRNLQPVEKRRHTSTNNKRIEIIIIPNPTSIFVSWNPVIEYLAPSLKYKSGFRYAKGLRVDGSIETELNIPPKKDKGIRTKVFKRFNCSKLFDHNPIRIPMSPKIIETPII